MEHQNESLLSLLTNRNVARWKPHNNDHLTQVFTQTEAEVTPNKQLLAEQIPAPPTHSNLSYKPLSWPQEVRRQGVLL